MLPTASPSPAPPLRPFLFLLLCNLAPLTSSHALPRQTSTVELRALRVLDWPLPPSPSPAPSRPPADPLRARQFNTICGYIGGDPALPATCSAGSHCVLDADHGAIGCCPDAGPCSSGIFTGCVDDRSGPQTEIDPYVYTCSGSDVCYKNTFLGGYTQYGCGSTAALATHVAQSASGRPPVVYTTVDQPLTASPTLAQPTTLGTKASSAAPTTTTDPATRPASTTASSLSPSSSSSSSFSPSSSGPSVSHSSALDHASTRSASASISSTPTALAAPSSNGNDSKNTGAIIGGTVGAFAVVAVLVAMGLWLWRRQRSNKRDGPGLNQETKYISPMSGGGHDFAPVGGGGGGFGGGSGDGGATYPHDAGMPQDLAQVYTKAYGDNVVNTRGGLATSYMEAGRPSSDLDATASADWGYNVGRDSHRLGFTARGGSHSNMEPDRVPLTREIDDFSRDFNTALEDIREDDGPASNTANMTQYPGSRSRSQSGGGGPLWQQNRRQSRYMMWM